MVLTSFSIPDITCCFSLLSMHDYLQAALNLGFDLQILGFVTYRAIIGCSSLRLEGSKLTGSICVLRSTLSAVIQRLQCRISMGVQSPS